MHALKCGSEQHLVLSDHWDLVAGGWSAPAAGPGPRGSCTGILTYRLAPSAEPTVGVGGPGTGQGQGTEAEGGAEPAVWVLPFLRELDLGGAGSRREAESRLLRGRRVGQRGPRGASQTGRGFSWLGGWVPGGVGAVSSG